MSAIDYEIQRFFDSMLDIRDRIDVYEKWMAKYLSFRPNYPKWTTKEGQELALQEITDNHLEKLIPFIAQKDPENKTKWIDIFKQEKRYRLIKNEINDLRRYYNKMQQVEEECF